jgi:NitT/TauT family transport system permease protein
MERSDSFWNGKNMGIIYGVISLAAFIGIWVTISASPKGGKVFANPAEVAEAFIRLAKNGKIYINIWSSLRRSLSGFSLAFCAAIPVAFLMGWYKPIRSIIEPWIKFIKSIPPIAYIPLVIVAQGVGEAAKITVIFIGSFLLMVISIYQGVVGVDNTLLKAATVLGANDFQMFVRVVIPASVPYILVAMRLGMASSLTTLVAAEMTGAQTGLGQMIQEAGMYFQMDVVLLGILLIGVMGFLLDRLISLLERRITAWQETRTV